MRDALFLIAGVPPLLRRHDFGAYQLESKGFSEGPQKWATRRGSVSGRYIALRVAISPFLISEPYDGPPVSQDGKAQRTYFVSACSALPLSDSIRSIDFVSETL
jgi:hypothetical protein